MQYVIWSVEHEGWWRPNGWGYCATLAVAGRFDDRDAEVRGWKARADRGELRSVFIPVAALAGAVIIEDEANRAAAAEVR